MLLAELRLDSDLELFLDEMVDTRWRNVDFLVDALSRAVQSRFTQREIAEDLGFDEALLSQLKSRLSMGREKRQALLKWLIDHGIVDTHDMVVGPYGVSLRDSVRAPRPPYPNRVYVCTTECPGCGEWVPGPDAHATFCLVCAEPLMKECPYCGNANRISAKHCDGCGRILSARHVRDFRSLLHRHDYTDTHIRVEHMI